MIKINGEKIEFKHFPNGELIFNKKDIHVGYAKIEIRYESDSELMQLYYLKLYLDERKIESELFIQYMPYSRMDRDNDDYAFTLKYVSKFINSLGFKWVSVLEPHSDVTCALLDNSIAVSHTPKYINKILREINLDNVYLFYPDAGAQKRYSKELSHQSIVGFKSRNFTTGEIDYFEIVGKVENPDTVIIVDDLCSRGGTFIESAKELRKVGFKNVYLFVTHCENNIYNGEIFKTDLINHVYTTDSIFKSYNEQKTDKITVFKV